MIKNSQRQKEKRAAAKWLLGLIGEDWGIRVLPSGADELRPVHANTNERFESVIVPDQAGRAAGPPRIRRVPGRALGTCRRRGPALGPGSTASPSA